MERGLAYIVGLHKYVLDQEKDLAWRGLGGRSFGFQSFLAGFSCRTGGRAVGEYSGSSFTSDQAT